MFGGQFGEFVCGVWGIKVHQLSVTGSDEFLNSSNTKKASLVPSS